MKKVLYIAAAIATLLVVADIIAGAYLFNTTIVRDYVSLDSSLSGVDWSPYADKTQKMLDKFAECQSSEHTIQSFGGLRGCGQYYKSNAEATARKSV